MNVLLKDKKLVSEVNRSKVINVDDLEIRWSVRGERFRKTLFSQCN